MRGSFGRFFILPMDIPGKYYPLFLTVLFSLMRGRWFDLWCAVGVGYAYATVSKPRPHEKFAWSGPGDCSLLHS